MRQTIPFSGEGRPGHLRLTRLDSGQHADNTPDATIMPMALTLVLAEPTRATIETSTMVVESFECFGDETVPVLKPATPEQLAAVRTHSAELAIRELAGDRRAPDAPPVPYVEHLELSIDSPPDDATNWLMNSPGQLIGIEHWVPAGHRRREGWSLTSARGIRVRGAILGRGNVAISGLTYVGFDTVNVEA